MKSAKKPPVVKTSRNKELFFFSIIFLLTAVAWIIVEVYHIENNKKFAVEYHRGMSLKIESLPSLEVINKLEQRL